MTSIVKAVLLNVGAFLSDNNIRRSIGAFSYNFTSPTGAVSNQSFSLQPLATLTITTPMSTSSVTILHVSGPLNTVVSLRADSAYPSARNYSISVRRVHLIDSDVGQIVITNPSTTTAVNISLIQA